MALRPSEIGAKDQAEMNRMFEAMRMLEAERQFRNATDTFDKPRFKEPNEFDGVLDAVVIEKTPPQNNKGEFDDIFG